ncbi:hypothetical protein JOF41_006575 [Saccharothrix coeruleofusca]|uniref:hypothetical protein n=1 Tax=Saccharothrix coeruleofusca TaxID=33919 RepID=UPI001AE7BAF6|nr:hypothetical protein [Saccharothrix coeruleofusca]MBP2340397.1 hypothetical protein [Saccharothrix coeruleofusca]
MHRASALNYYPCQRARGGCLNLAPGRTATTRRTWSHLPGLDFVTADAAEYLATTTTSFDIIHSIFGAVRFTDPAEVVAPPAPDQRGTLLVRASAGRARHG